MKTKTLITKIKNFFLGIYAVVKYFFMSKKDKRKTLNNIDLAVKRENNINKALILKQKRNQWFMSFGYTPSNATSTKSSKLYKLNILDRIYNRQQERLNNYLTTFFKVPKSKLKHASTKEIEALEKQIYQLQAR